jgi:hypothetical protein
VILSLFVARDRLGDATPIREADLALMQRIISAKPRAVIAMTYGNPHHLRKIPEVRAYLIGYGEREWFGNQETYFSSFIRALKGELNPEGRLPVNVSDAYPIGSGLSSPVLPAAPGRTCANATSSWWRATTSRPSANRTCWPAQAELESLVAAVFARHGRRIVRGDPVDAAAGHGFLDSQARGIEVFHTIDPGA